MLHFLLSQSLPGDECVSLTIKKPFHLLYIDFLLASMPRDGFAPLNPKERIYSPPCLSYLHYRGRQGVNRWCVFFWLSYYYALLIPKSFDNTNIRPFIPVWYPLDPRFIPDSSPIWSRRENQELIDDQHGIMHTLVQWYLRNQGRPALLVPCSHHRCTIILSDWLLIIKTGSGQALVCINRLGSPDKSIFNIGH